MTAPYRIDSNAELGYSVVSMAEGSDRRVENERKVRRGLYDEVSGVSTYHNSGHGLSILKMTHFPLTEGELCRDRRDTVAHYKLYRIRPLIDGLLGSLISERPTAPLSIQPYSLLYTFTI